MTWKVAFYRDGLGFATQGIVGTQFEHGAVAFFDLDGGFKLALWPRKSLAHDAGIAVSKPAATKLYAGYFQDPDQHLWEVAWNPQWTEPQ